MIRPEIRVLIAAIRAGKKETDALVEYCWAKSVVPIKWNRWVHHPSNPIDERPVFYGTMAMARLMDAYEDGANDEGMQQAFDEGLAWDADNTEFAWRAMKPEERPTTGELIRAMPMDDTMKAASLFGVGNVGKMMLGK